MNIFFLDIYLVALLLLHTIISTWAFFKIFGSSLDGASKALWLVIVGLFPGVGFLVYLFFGRRD